MFVIFFDIPIERSNSREELCTKVEVISQFVKRIDHRMCFSIAEVVVVCRLETLNERPPVLYARSLFFSLRINLTSSAIADSVSLLQL